MFRMPVILLKKTDFYRPLQSLSLKLTFILSIFFLSSCGGIEYISDNFKKPIILKCPNYLIPEEASKILKFRDGPGSDLVDVKYEVDIKNIKLGCLSNINRKTKLGSMEIDLTLDFSANLGPANPDKKINFDYFVSVVSPRQEIINQKIIPLSLMFPKNKSTLLFSSKPVDITLQITAEKPVRYYRIFVGLRLSKEEVRYNRQKNINYRRR